MPDALAASADLPDAFKALVGAPRGLDKVGVTPEEEIELQFTAEEFAAIHALAPLIARSPRATKRFINSYRPIRARQRGVPLDEFLGAGDEAPYAAVAFLLAIEIGLEAEARHFISDIVAWSATLADLLNALAKEATIRSRSTSHAIYRFAAPSSAP